VDEKIGPADRAWVAARHDGDALLHKVNSRAGLVAEDYAALAEWGWRTRMAD